MTTAPDATTVRTRKFLLAEGHFFMTPPPIYNNQTFNTNTRHAGATNGACL